MVILLYYGKCNVVTGAFITSFFKKTGKLSILLVDFSIRVGYTHILLG